MPDERRQQIGPTVQALELLNHCPAQLHCILGGGIRQPGVLGVLPHVLVGIGLRAYAGNRSVRISGCLAR